jgi:signal transduction histidine kinase
VALAAAAWQSEREADAERLASLAAQLDALIPELQPADLARPALSRSVAATLRLPRDREPEWAQRLAPFLPEADAAGLTGSFVAAHEATIARRRALLRIEAALNDARKTANAPSIARTKEGALWTLPLNTGTSLAAIVEPASFVDAITRAGEAGALPRWPWLVQAELHDGDSPPFAGIPFVRGLAPTARDPFSESAQLWPFATAALALLFAAAWRAQRRAAMRERDAMTAQAEFLTNVTHELKTPLASIRLLGEMLAEGRAKGREREYHAMLKAESARLSTLVESVLDLGRTERGERALSVRDFDLAEAARESAALLDPLLASEGRTIAFSAPQTTSAMMARGDRDAATQALVAVLDNARKYGRGQVDIAVTADAESMRVEVRDRGDGVDASERERIFERFVRGARHRHGSTPGAGIGLYLARAVLRQLGGDLAAVSPDDGIGARFVLTLPKSPHA